MKALFFVGGAILGSAATLVLLKFSRKKPLTLTSKSVHRTNGERAKEIARVTPYFPFKGIARFYDIGGFLRNPEVFATVIEALVERYQTQQLDAVFGIDARGFVLGAPLALALKVPFFMLRKRGKMPNAISGRKYSKEYKGDDSLCIQRGSITKGDKIVLIDDLVATGGTLIAGIELVKQLGGNIVECACVVKLKALKADSKLAANGHSDVNIWALVDESILTLDGIKDPSIDTRGYEDDGDSH